MPTNVFINEIHYDNAGTDAGEFVEIAGPAGTSLVGWKVVLYNGNPSQRSAYSTITLTAADIIPSQQGGFGTVRIGYGANGVQNGGTATQPEPDGVALVAPDGTVVQFLSWEGSFTAASGPAAGMTSVDIGVFEDGTQNGTSVGLTGTGTTYESFQWKLIGDDTPGGVNAGQSFGDGPPPTKPGKLSIADAAVDEGNSGVREMVFVVTRADGSDGAVSATWTINLGTGAGAADADDLGAGAALTGTVTFAAGATTAEIRVPIKGDAVYEPSETFDIVLSNPQGGATLGDASAVGAINNDDVAPPAPTANVFINEIHYDNDGLDSNEGIEIAGTAGTNLSGYKLVFYNGTDEPQNAPAYRTVNLSGVIDNESNGFGALAFMLPRNGAQNGDADGVALIAPDGTVIQLISYEGRFTAAAGTPAGGRASTDINVSEDSSSPEGWSLQLKGNGALSGDFTWSSASDDSFGSLNAGQTFLAADEPGQLKVQTARVQEGNAGVTDLVVTVTRSGGTALSGSADYSIQLDGGLTADDLADGAVLSGTVNFAPGETFKTIVIPIKGDTVGEHNESLTVKLSNPTGDVVIARDSATSTVVNDDLIELAIGTIQGAGHESDYVGQNVITHGIVTAVDSNGYYLQSATGDGDAATSDAIFVFTGTAPTVLVGDGVKVQGVVGEFQASHTALTVTQIVSPTTVVESSGNALPAAVLIGTGGILPPTATIDDDGLGTFDPLHDGIDFWESLEGMRVTIDTPQAVSNTNEYGETDVVASHGVGATGVNGRGGITISDGDYNPEKIQIDDDSAIFGGYAPGHSIGDQLSSVTGIVNYAQNKYEVLVTEAVTVTKDVTLEREQSALHGNGNDLSIASFNVENLDPGDTKFEILAEQIVYNLRGPDIIALQEVQDADGEGSGPDLSGVVTAQKLIDAIYSESGQRYAYIEIAPTVAGETGGAGGGNIRNGYLYNIDRVDYVEGSAHLIEDESYEGSRRPLVAAFEFAGQTITTINVHLTSRLVSEPLWGDHQPAMDAGDAARTAQAAAVKAYINDHLADDPAMNIAVLGDWNGFYFEDAQTQLTDPAKGGVLTNLATLLPEEERYSYMYEGNAQLIDNILVTGGLVSGAQYDAVHINAQLAKSAQSTDHDPQLALLRLGAAPKDLVLSNASVAENLPAGTVVGTLSATDTANDTLSYALLDNGGGLFAVDAATGVITTTAALNHEALAQIVLVAKVTDSGGLSTQQSFTVKVTDVNEAPVATADAIAVNEDATTANLWATLLGNDSDPDVGQTLSITSVDSSGTLGSLVFDAATKTLKYVADNDAFDALAPGATQVDHFTYTVTDGNGLTSTATVAVTVTGIADGVSRHGTIFSDTLNGSAGEDVLSGGLGNDTLNGLGGHDWLNGGLGNDKLYGNDGNDVLFGDLGNDTLWGGNGRDILFGGLGDDTLYGGAGGDGFHFGRFEGSDTIADFSTADDVIILDDGVSVTRTKVQDVNRDGVKDLTLTLSWGTSVTLLGVSDASAVKFGAPDYYSDHQPGLGGLLDDIGDLFGNLYAGHQKLIDAGWF